MASGRRAAGLLLVLLGLLVLAYAAARGDLRIGLFLIIPFAYGVGFLPFLGMALLLVGGFLALTAGLRPMPHDEPPAWERASRAPGEDAPGAARRSRHGGFVLLGPIPIVWGNDRRLLPWLVGIGLALLALTLLLPLLLQRAA